MHVEPTTLLQLLLTTLLRIKYLSHRYMRSRVTETIKLSFRGRDTVHVKLLQLYGVAGAALSNRDRLDVLYPVCH